MALKPVPIQVLIIAPVAIVAFVMTRFRVWLEPPFMMSVFGAILFLVAFAAYPLCGLVCCSECWSGLDASLAKKRFRKAALYLLGVILSVLILVDGVVLIGWLFVGQFDDPYNTQAVWGEWVGLVRSEEAEDREEWWHVAGKLCELEQVGRLSESRLVPLPWRNAPLGVFEPWKRIVILDPRGLSPYFWHLPKCRRALRPSDVDVFVFIPAEAPPTVGGVVRMQESGGPGSMSAFRVQDADTFLQSLGLSEGVVEPCAPHRTPWYPEAWVLRGMGIPLSRGERAARRRLPGLLAEAREYRAKQEYDAAITRYQRCLTIRSDSSLQQELRQVWDERDAEAREEEAAREHARRLEEYGRRLEERARWRAERVADLRLRAKEQVSLQAYREALLLYDEAMALSDDDAIVTERQEAMAARDAYVAEVLASATASLKGVPDDPRSLGDVRRDRLTKAAKAIQVALVQMPKNSDLQAAAGRIEKAFGRLEIECGRGVTLRLVKVCPGTVRFEQDGTGPDGMVRPPVAVSEAYYIGAYEVTLRQFKAVMGKPPLKMPPTRLSRALGVAYCVLWEEAEQFCRRLSAISGQQVRLPTEVEWEYACRAGATTAYCYGDDVVTLKDYAWYKDNAFGNIHPAGQKKPNAWGLYDMHGNASEWCADLYVRDPYQHGNAPQPQGSMTGANRVLRGGDFTDTADVCRAGSRESGWDAVYCGFRVLVEIPEADGPHP
ncbi:MAG: SUMF1/EgtB/PvdO family nonheme iron enzyme [Planctomycetota bacterium]